MSETLAPADGLKHEMAKKIRNARKALHDWQLSYARNFPAPFYCSVDLRDAGYKIAPVDSNLYPAGFNNICPDDLRAAGPIARAQLDAALSRLGHETPQKLLIIPETHTGNTYYIENLYYLTELMKQAGLDVRIGWYGTNTEEITLISATQKELRASPIRIEDNFLRINGFTPDAILLNNDFSSGYPKILDTVRQPILPSHSLGWHTLKKSENCLLYNKLATEFAEITGIDPWTITIDTEEVAPVDFNENEGIENVAKSVEKMLARMNDAHRKRAIKHQPFVFIKNNHGTYGMGIMVVHDAKEVLSMNRRAKNKMSIGKGHLKIDSVIIQEGIPTATIVDRLPAEPVIYLFGSELIGGFLRTNKERGIEDNLNSAGMVFRKLCMSDLRDADENGDEPLLELVYGSIARISAIATGIELHNHLTSRA